MTEPSEFIVVSSGSTAPVSPDPARPPSEVPRPAKQNLMHLPLSRALLVLARQCVAGNYLYLASAALMLLGCYGIMRTGVLGGAGAFGRTFRALAVLQGYEVLVIATAAIVAARLRALDDALTLLLAEIALLLDPTFFSNSFATMPGAEGAWINAGCAVLAVAKFGLVGWLLGLRFHRRTWAAFVVAFVVAYGAGHAPSADRVTALGMPFATYCYVLLWMPLLVAILLPGRGKRMRLQAGGPHHKGVLPDGEEGAAAQAGGPHHNGVSPMAWRIDAGRLASTDGALFVVPLVVLAAHAIEAAVVDDKAFSFIELAPIVLAVAVQYVKSHRGLDPRGLLHRMDTVLLGLGAMLLLSSAEDGRLVARSASLGWTCVACAALYLWVARLTHRRGATVRACLLGGLGIVLLATQFAAGVVLLDALWHAGQAAAGVIGHVAAVVAGAAGTLVGALGKAAGAVARVVGAGWNLLVWMLSGPARGVGHGIDWLWQLLWAHLQVVGAVLWVAWLVAAIRVRSTPLWLAFAFATITAAVYVVPGGFDEWSGEYAQAVLALAIVGCRLWIGGRPGQGEVILAAILCVIGVARLATHPSLMTCAVAVAETVTFLIVGVRLRSWGFLIVSALDAVFLTHEAWAATAVRMSDARWVVGLVALSLTIFAAGIVVTFHKARFLAFLDDLAPPVPARPKPHLEDSEEEPWQEHMENWQRERAGESLLYGRAATGDAEAGPQENAGDGAPGAAPPRPRKLRLAGKEADCGPSDQSPPKPPEQPWSYEI